MIIRVNRMIIAISVAGLLASCAATDPPPLPANNPADPQARQSISYLGSFSMVDATTRAITDRLKQSPEVAEKHGGNMPGMQHGDMKMEEQKQKPEATPTAAFFYTCPMHHQVHQDKPGKCPICGITLVKREGKPPQ